MNKEIELRAQTCEICQLHKNNPPKVRTHIWEPAKAPMERVHIDFAGPYMSVIFFVLVDAYSKWPEVHIVKNMLAENTIELCTDIFSRYGIPAVVVSKEIGFQHVRTAPFHPVTNEQAERYVQTIKYALAKIENTSNIGSELNKILFQYRSMPHAQTAVSPAELFLGRKLRGKLDLLKPVAK